MLNPNRKIYGICNCGLYEGEQNEFALEVLRNWSVKCGYIWSGAVGIGGGGATLSLTSMGTVGIFFMGPVRRAVKALGQAAVCEEGLILSKIYDLVANTAKSVANSNRI